MSRELRTNRHSVFNLKYHLVVVTKYRKKCLTKEMLKDLEDILKEQLEGKDCKLIEFNGEEDHIHILFESQPQIQLTKIVNSLKTVTSRLLNKKYKTHLNKFFETSTLWSRSYCILTTGGATIETIKKYIENQKEL
ncbi:MAG: IS200/IS605 family transposase [Eubacteriales bacterium]